MLDPREEDLEKLAETCLATAKQIKEYLAANKHPQPTFDQNGPSSFPAATPEIQHARLDLRTAAKRLYELASGPEDIVTWHLYQSVSPCPRGMSDGAC
jgi:6-hydroxytryprostatin B O-methyltransferase